jgi:hypothetical protein
LAETNQGELIDGNLDVHTSRTLGPARITGNLRVASQAVLTLNGTVWVDGTIDIAGGSSIRGKGPLVARGRIDLKGNAEPLVEQMPVIISTENAICVSGDTVTYAVLYAPNDLIDVRGSGGVNGAIIGKEVSVSISAITRAIYDMRVIEQVRVPTVNILSWEVSQH